jgi:FkbH-like protein
MLDQSKAHAMSVISDDYARAEREMSIPPVSERGRTNQNPPDIGFWALVAEDFRTHERKLFEQGFWAVFANRFGNWRMGQPKLIRAPATALYLILFKMVEIFGGISLWYTVKLGRRVRIWHHSGVILGARAIGDDVQIRQNTTIGVGQTGRNADLPIIGARADIGAGACIAGAVYVGRDAKVGGNALVVTDVPDGATVMGNPAQIVSLARAPAKSAEPAAPQAPAPVRAAATRSAAADRPMLATPLDVGDIALLGSANLDYLAMSFTQTADRFGLTVRTHVPDFGTARMELLQPRDASALQKAMDRELTATLVVERAEDVLGAACSAPLSLAPEDADAYVDDALQPMLQIIRDAHAKLRGPVFVLRLAALQRSPLGLADMREARGRDALIDKANARLAAELDSLADVHLLDVDAMIAEVGRKAAAPGEYWHIGRVPFGEAFNRHLAQRVLGALLSVRGKTARILVLDLDNTLWGGVLGEDGIEGVKIGGAYPGSAFKEFQTALRALTDRGIVLALASKNDEDLALRMIADHPEMALRPADFVSHRINWSEKASNIQDMLDEIGLGAGSCMFIDDNPVEREKVRKVLPDCIVPEFPEAPETLTDWLLENPFLECLELTGSDLKRSSQYKVRAKVNAAKSSAANITDFYKDLEMRLTFEPFGAMNQQRALQLFVKTNQFNTTTRRHDANSVRSILDEGGEVYAIGLQDKHSDYELIGVIVLRSDAAMAAAYPQDPAVGSMRHDGVWWVDSFLLSCRVLGRTVEHAILAWATSRAAERGATALIGQIIETPRNTPVRAVFGASGFATMPEEGGKDLWLRDLTAPEGPAEAPDYFVIDLRDPDVAPPAPRSAPAPASTPAVEAARAPAALVAAPIPGAQALPPDVEADLAQVFRTLFRLDPAADLSTATMDSVEHWDSLGHLKLAMEVERQLGVRLPGAVIGDIRTYAELTDAVSERL